MAEMEVRGLSKWRLNRPFNQNLIMGTILFCLPGIYLALTGLGAGGGGPRAGEVAVDTNAILYGIFTVTGWAAGPLLNTFKPRLTIFIGCIGYPLYVGGLWYFDRVGHSWFSYFGGVMLGVTAGCLWTGAGYIAFSYAEEWNKGKYVAIQWGLTSLGGTVGAAVAFGVSFHETGAIGASNAVYITFISIMCVALLAASLLLRDPAKIVRDDGTYIAQYPPTQLRHEFANIKLLLTDWNVYILIPTFFASEMCLATVSSINSYYFSLRARSLNNVLFQFVQILVAISLSYVLDHPKLSRRKRGLLACSALSVITLAALASLVGWMKKNHLDGRLIDPPDVDWTDGRFAGGVIIYILFGIVYSGYLVCAQWVIASLSNNPVRCALYSGFAKGTSSFGLCICFVMDSKSVTYMDQVIVQFVLYTAGLLAMLYVVMFNIKETNYLIEADVVVPTHLQEHIHGVTTTSETKELAVLPEEH